VLKRCCHRALDYVAAGMKKLAMFVFLVPTVSLVFFGCANQGPDPEQASREAQQRREAERQQAEFRKSLPPLSNPSQVR